MAIRRRTEVDAIAATILVNVLVCRPVVYIIIMIPKIPMSDEAAGALGTQYCVVGWETQGGGGAAAAGCAQESPGRNCSKPRTLGSTRGNNKRREGSTYYSLHYIRSIGQSERNEK